MLAMPPVQRWLVAAILLIAPAVGEAGLPVWHDLFRYGGLDPEPADVWEDLCEDVYGERKLDDLYADPCRLFNFGCGYAGCAGCRIPLHYESGAHFESGAEWPAAATAREFPGASWYRNVPVGQRHETAPGSLRHNGRAVPAPAPMNGHQHPR